jgi:hypothetical protein
MLSDVTYFTHVLGGKNNLRNSFYWYVALRRTGASYS